MIAIQTQLVSSDVIVEIPTVVFYAGYTSDKNILIFMYSHSYILRLISILQKRINFYVVCIRIIICGNEFFLICSSTFSLYLGLTSTEQSQSHANK